jgi:hypothetical protein
MKKIAPKKQNLIRSENPVLRNFSFSAFHLAQGYTYGLPFFTIPAWLATEVQNGRSVNTNESHCSQFDDPETYFMGMIDYIKDVDDGIF